MNRAERRKRRTQARKSARGSGNTRQARPAGQDSASHAPVGQLLDTGIRHHAAGELPQAAECYQAILDANPDHPGALHLLGVSSHQSGAPDAAVDLIARSLEFAPGNADAHYDLGNALKDLGQADRAATHYHEALALKPDYTEAHNNLGILFQQLGRAEEAIESYRNAIASNPEDAGLHANLGNALKAAGLQQDAVLSYRNALALDPDNAGIHNNLGNILKDLDDMAEAEACYRKAISLQPGFAEAHYNLGIVMQYQGMLEAAEAAYRTAIRLNDGYAVAHNNLGVVLQDLGRLKEAESCYRRCLAIDPDFAVAYRHLMLITKRTDYDNDIDAMEQLYAKADLTDDRRLHLALGLGKAYEDLGQYEKAFSFFAAGNRIKRRMFPFSIEAHRRFTEHIKQTFDAALFARHSGAGHHDPTPVFILGMPRSGTTLCEQILSSHPLVYGAGELETLKRLALTGIGNDMNGLEFPDTMRHADSETLSRLGEAYIRDVRRHNPDSPFITDKMPGNFTYLGLIRLILPDAKVIHCRRDPADTCLSIFKNHLSGDHRYAHDLRALGEYYVLYEDLMAHWRGVLPGYIHDIRYEDLIADQASETRSLLEFCGLEWDDACLEFHRTTRPVRTASFEQVRRPLYRDSIRQWKRYEKELTPLLGVLSHTDRQK